MVDKDKGTDLSSTLDTWLKYENKIKSLIGIHIKKL